jgi:hypothetical protein
VGIWTGRVVDDYALELKRFAKDAQMARAEVQCKFAVTVGSLQLCCYEIWGMKLTTASATTSENVFSS